jgi:hypothetical protein
MADEKTQLIRLKIGEAKLERLLRFTGTGDDYLMGHGDVELANFNISFGRPCRWPTRINFH